MLHIYHLFRYIFIHLLKYFFIFTFCLINNYNFIDYFLDCYLYDGIKGLWENVFFIKSNQEQLNSNETEAKQALPCSMIRAHTSPQIFVNIMIFLKLFKDFLLRRCDNFVRLRIHPKWNEPERLFDMKVLCFNKQLGSVL